MALSQTYCDFATGNDYKGTSFTDGAWTAATHTLTKTGAFAATKVNHWLYLEPNGGSSFTAGYFKVATVPDANSVTLATDPAVGNLTDVKCTQHDGTALLPWRSVQGAVDLITRDATNGDQVNIKGGTAQVNQASLALTTYGTPTYSVPLVLRGYTATAGDYGIGEIDCNGAPLWAVTNHVAVYLIDLHIHSGGNNALITQGASAMLLRCEVDKGASTPSGKTLVTASDATVMQCYIHDAGTSGNGVYCSGQARVIGNYIENCPNQGIQVGLTGPVVLFNIVTGSQIGIRLDQSSSTVIGNTVYAPAASTGKGYWSSNAARDGQIWVNNIAEGYSGAGGVGFDTASRVGFQGYNAAYNCATAYATAHTNAIELRDNDTLTGSPFVDGANGDFDINGTVANVTEDAWPQAWPGLTTTTTPKPDRGAVQAGAGTSGGGGFPKIASLLGRTRM